MEIQHGNRKIEVVSINDQSGAEVTINEQYGWTKIVLQLSYTELQGLVTALLYAIGAHAPHVQVQQEVNLVIKNVHKYFRHEFKQRGIDADSLGSLADVMKIVDTLMARYAQQADDFRETTNRLYDEKVKLTQQLVECMHDQD